MAAWATRSTSRWAASTSSRTARWRQTSTSPTCRSTSSTAPTRRRPTARRCSGTRRGTSPTNSICRRAFAIPRITRNTPTSAAIPTGHCRSFASRTRPVPFDINNPPNCALFDGVAGQPLFDISAEFDSEQTDYRVALDYHFTEDLMAYGQVATGYKGGGVNPRPFFIVQIETFEPEEMETYEIGFKSTLFDDRMRLNVAVFFNDYSDIVLEQLACELPFPPFFGGTLPAARQRRFGRRQGRRARNRDPARWRLLVRRIDQLYRLRVPGRRHGRLGRDP